VARLPVERFAELFPVSPTIGLASALQRDARVLYAGIAVLGLSMLGRLFIEFRCGMLYREPRDHGRPRSRGPLS
jgi:hypothetical protein